MDPDKLLDLIDEFKTDVGLKEEQLDQLLDHNKEMVEIAEVLEQAAHSKREDISSLKDKIEVTNKTVDSTQKDLSATLQELQKIKIRLVEQCEENHLTNREMESQKNLVQNMKMQLGNESNNEMPE